MPRFLYAELDVADELAIIEYVGNTKNTQSNNCPEEEIVSAQVNDFNGE